MLNPNYLKFIALLVVVFASLSLVAFKKEILLTRARLQKLLLIAHAYMGATSALFCISLPFDPFLKAVLGLICGGFFVYEFKKIAALDPQPWLPEYRVRLDFFLLLTGILIVSYSSLLWGYGFNFDWPKHRSVLLSLYAHPLNPGMEGFGLRQPLVYYYAPYLPPVYISKALNLFFSPPGTASLLYSLSLASFLWNLAGLLIAMLLAPAACLKLFQARAAPKVFGVFFVVFLFFSGADFWAALLTGGLRGNLGNHMERVNPAWYNAQYHSVFSLWGWVPGQMISALLGLVFLGIFSAELQAFPLCTWSAFSLACSPFNFIGLAPLAAFTAVQSFLRETSARKPALLRWLKDARWELAGSFALLFFVRLFFADRKDSDALIVNPDLAAKGVLTYFFFLARELGPAALIVLLARRLGMIVSKLVLLAFGTLLLIGLFSLGIYNDWALKASIPALLLLALYCGAVFENCQAERLPLSERGLIFAIAFAAAPLLINELVFMLRVNAPALELRPLIVAQYIGKGFIF